MLSSFQIISHPPFKNNHQHTCNKDRKERERERERETKTPFSQPTPFCNTTTNQPPLYIHFSPSFIFSSNPFLIKNPLYLDRDRARTEFVLLFTGLVAKLPTPPPPPPPPPSPTFLSCAIFSL